MLILGVLNLKTALDVTITAEDVSRGKPDPQVFLIAARRLRVAPARSVVIEDAPAGIEAARTAGMCSIAVATTHPPEELARADVVAKDLVEVTGEMVDWLLEGERDAA
jgi:sugar-phosphatase